MVGDTALSNERRRALASGLAQLALRDKVVPAMLAKAGPPLNSFPDWQDAQDKMTENVQRLLTFVEAQGYVDVLETALRLASLNGAVPAAPVAPGPRAEDVAITQPIKDELVAVLKEFSTGPDDLRRSALSAFGDAKIADRVAWHKSIEEVAFQLVDQAYVEGTLYRLVDGLYRERPTNRAIADFVKKRFSMLYQDPIETRTAVKWAASASVFEAIVVARRTPLLDRVPVRNVLSCLFTTPDNGPTVLTIDGPSRVGKSYVASLLDFLVYTGIRGRPETRPHTAGQHKYALLKPVQRGALHTVQEVASDLFSQLGWKHNLPLQHKTDDGWAQEVIFEFRNQLAIAEDVIWIVADKYWDFPQSKPIVDFFVGLVREATLMAGRNKLRLMLIDFPTEPLERFIEDNGEAQFERILLDWLTPKDVKQFCDAFAAGNCGANTAVSADTLFAAISQRVDHTRSGAELQYSWCTALKQELGQYW